MAILACTLVSYPSTGIGAAAGWGFAEVIFKDPKCPTHHAAEMAPSLPRDAAYSGEEHRLCLWFAALVPNHLVSRGFSSASLMHGPGALSRVGAWTVR